MKPLTNDDLAEATATVRRFMSPTPAYPWPLLAQAIGTEVWVKHEDATPTGAFKVRGGLVFADRLLRGPAAIDGLVSATTGNHGQSLAFAGRAMGLAVTIVVPHGNSPEKNAAMRAFGATVVEHGHDFQAARDHSVELAEERSLMPAPPFHRDLVAGVATATAELFATAGELDAIFVPVGMGSGINAAMAVRDLLGAPTEVIGVTAAGAPAMARSFAASAAVSTESVATFADGVATRSPDPEALAGVLAGAADIVSVTDDEMAEAIRLLFRSTHHLSCGAGAAALAALVAQRDRWHGRRVAVIHTSSNIDTPLAATVLAGHTPPSGGR